MYEEVRELFDQEGWFRFNKKIARQLGTNEAIILGVIIDKDNYWNKRADRFRKLTKKEYEGQFFITRDYIKNETGLSHYHQREAEKALIKKGVLDRNRRGIPAKNWYSIDYDRLADLLSEYEDEPIYDDEESDVNEFENQILNPLTSGCQNFEELDVYNFECNKNIQLDHIKKIINRDLDSDHMEYITDIVNEYFKDLRLDYTLIRKIGSLNLEDTQFLSKNLSRWPVFCREHPHLSKSDGSLHMISNNATWNKFKKWTIAHPPIRRM